MSKVPEDDKSMLICLATEGKELENVSKTIYMIKSEDDFFKNVANLKRAKAPELRRTLAFLLATTEEDERVARLYSSGLRKMIMVRAKQLMPKYCKPCNTGKPYYYMRGEVSLVTCVRCKSGACPTCYTGRESKWRYLCEECEPVVSSDMGYDRLELGGCSPIFPFPKILLKFSWYP